jgi:pSer/pThr/pTyr-binding forkhead associated (FHA) protein
MSILLLHLPGLPPVAHVLKDETITIGRMKGNTIVIEDTSISLMHAKITRKNNEFFLKDLNSTNGTMVNGQPISEAKLRDLDHVRFAEISGLFQAEPALQAILPAASPVSPSATVLPAPPTALAAPIAAAPIAVAPMAAAPQPASGLPVGLIASATAQALQKSRKRWPALIGMWAGAAAGVAAAAFAAWHFWQVNASASLATANATTLATSLTAPRPAQPLGKAPREKAQGTPNALNSPATNSKRSPNSGADANDPQQLIAGLKSTDPTQRRQAAEAMHSLGPESVTATPALKDALRDSDGEVQMWAALTLVKNQAYDKAAIPVLVRTLQHENSMLRQVACLSLGLIPYQDSEKEAVTGALAESADKDTDEEVRQAAKSALNIIAPDLVGKIGAN